MFLFGTIKVGNFLGFEYFFIFWESLDKLLLQCSSFELPFEFFLNLDTFRLNLLGFKWFSLFLSKEATLNFLSSLYKDIREDEILKTISFPFLLEDEMLCLFYDISHCAQSYDDL